jgi:hypothetical protein
MNDEKKQKVVTIVRVMIGLAIFMVITRGLFLILNEGNDHIATMTPDYAQHPHWCTKLIWVDMA